MAKRDPWVVIDLMTNEHVSRHATEVEALKVAVARGGCDVRFWR